MQNSNAKVFEVMIKVNEFDSILRPSMTTKNTIKDGKCWCIHHFGGEGAWLDPAEFYVKDKDDPSAGMQPLCKECAKVYKRKNRNHR